MPVQMTAETQVEVRVTACFLDGTGRRVGEAVGVVCKRVFDGVSIPEVSANTSLMTSTWMIDDERGG